MTSTLPTPCNVDIEGALIGAILLANDAFRRVAQIVQPEHFAEPAHQQIWAVLAAMLMKGHPANPITLKTYLGDEDFGGITPVQYLANLVKTSTGVANVADYARMVRDLFLRRQIIALADRARAVATDAPVEATSEAIFADIERHLEGLRPAVQGEAAEFQDFDDISQDEIYEAHRDKKGFVGLSTGLPRLDEVLNGLQNSDLIILAGRPAMGKAQPLDAAIKTIDGWTTMGELRVGQELASHDGQRSVVTGIFPQGARPVFEITFSDGRKTRACDEHLWRVVCSRWPVPRILTTAQVRDLMGLVRYRGRLSVDLVSGDFGRRGYLPLDPWLLGLILGNGRVDGGIRLTTRDEENLARAERFLPTAMCLVRGADGTHTLRQRDGGRRPGHKGVAPNPVAGYLRSAGLTGEGCHVMFVPSEFLSACRGDRVALLQGLMDANGYVEKGGSVRFVTTSAQLAHDVEGLVRSLGGLCRVRSKSTSYRHNGKRCQGRTAFVCNIRHRDASMLFANSVKRQAATRTRNTSVRLTFASIKPAGVVKTQCIAVSHPDHLYVTDDYVVTHNTSLATCISVAVARHVAVRRQEGENLGTVGFFSLEMSAKQLKQRIVSEFAGVSAQRLMSGNGANEDMEAFDRARRDLAGLPLTIDQTGELSIAQLKLKARALKKRRGLSLLVIDYLQLLSGSSRKDNRVAEVTEITVGLKALAKELDIPIIALSQLSRKVEERDDKRPLLSDLRESGSIEQDADSVIFVYREEYYLKNAKPRDEGEALGRWYGQMKRWEGVAEAIVAKNRHGRSDTVELGFQAEFTRFTNEPDWRSPDPDEARKAAKTVKLTSHGEALREILRELAPAIGDRPTVEDLAKKPGLPPNALLIPRDEVRKRFFESVVADLPEAEAAKKLQAASDNLRGHKMTVRFTNAAGVNVIYLVELIAE